jgi:hypothetical protein
MVAVNSVPDLTSAFPNNKKVAASKSWMLVDAKGNQCCWKWSSMIHARDLSILDPLLSYPSTILRQEPAIVLNLEVRLLSVPLL